MRTLLLVTTMAACAVHAPALPAQDPASPRAESGRLAGAPPALRAGVVDYKDVPAIRPDAGGSGDGAHHHHH